MRQVGYLQGSYQDARPKKRKKIFFYLRNEKVSVRKYGGQL